MKNKSIPFNSDSSRFFLPWISALMVFFATLLIASGAFCYLSLTNWQKSVSSSLTVQIPTFTQTGKSRADVLDGEIEKTLTLLRATPGITGAEVLSDEQVNQLMQPWLAPGTSASSLPVPKLIDASIDPAGRVDINKLKETLTMQVPAASLEVHELWLNNLMNFAKILIQAISTLVILLIITISWTLMYITRSALTLHRFVISLMHMMGATDGFIIFQYAKRNALLTICGGIIGLIFCCPVLYYLNKELIQVIPVFEIFSTISVNQLFWLLLIPLGAGFVAFVTTYITVKRYLRQFI